MADIKGVKKVNERIMRDGRTVILTAEDTTNYNWDEIPNGTLHINPSTGLMSVKVDGETTWLPAGIKNDGTICIAKDSRIGMETFYIVSVDDGDGTFTVENEDGERRHFPLTEEGHHIFELEDGTYIKRRNHLDVFIDEALLRNSITGGLIEITEKRFALTETLVEGMTVTAKYVKVFNIGHPYPRIFVDEEEPEEAEYGDFWLDTDAKIDDEDMEEIVALLQDVYWSDIKNTPTSLAGYGIQDPVSYEGHTHEKTEIINFPVSLKADGGNADTVNHHYAGTSANNVLVLTSTGSVPLSVLTGATKRWWKANTDYAVGDIIQPLTVLKGQSYECVRSGTTFSIEPAWPTSNLSEFDDGTVRWKTKTSLGDSTPLGTPIFSLAQNPPEGYIRALGGEHGRDTYADLWQWAQDNDLVKSEAEWQDFKTVNNSCPFYSEGATEGMFRVPYIIDIFRPIDSVSGDRTVGDVQGDAIRNFTGEIRQLNDRSAVGPDPSPFYVARNGSSSAGLAGGQTGKTVYFDPSLVVPTAEENRMRNIGVNCYIKAYGAVTNAGDVELEEIKNDIDLQATRIAALQDTIDNIPEDISITITTGSVAGGGTIPLPSGYTRQQCKYSVWPGGAGGYDLRRFNCSVNQDTGVVAASHTTDVYGDGGNIAVGYLCIAIK